MSEQVQAADRDGIDVAGRRNGLDESQRAGSTRPSSMHTAYAASRKLIPGTVSQRLQCAHRLTALMPSTWRLPVVPGDASGHPV